MLPITHYRPTLEDVPMDTLLDQLTQVTGSEMIIPQDIPVIMRFACHLACTSKTLSEKVNQAVDFFLKSLSAKYHLPCEYLAASFNTKGAREWLWKYIQHHQLDRYYPKIIDIYTIAQKVLEESKDKGIVSEWAMPGPSPMLHPTDRQTETGILLCFGNFASNCYLLTPLGSIMLYCLQFSLEDPSALLMPHLSILHTLLIRSKAEFYQLNRGLFHYPIYECATSSEFADITYNDLNHMSKQLLSHKKGTQNVIFEYSPHSSLYQIKIDQEIPKILQKCNTVYNNRVWKMLAAHHTGSDPIHINRVTPRAPSAKQPRFPHISALSSWVCEQLNAMESFKLEKKIPMVFTFEEAVLLRRLNTISRSFLKKRFWSMNLERGDCKKNTTLNIFKPKKSCSVQTLQQIYLQILQTLSQNWQRAQLKDYRNSICHKSEEDHQLFVKKIKKFKLLDESRLMNFLLPQLGLGRFVRCGNILGENQHIYLWIKKHHLNDTLATLNIQN